MLDSIDNEELIKIPAVAEDEQFKDRLPKGYLSVSQVTQYMKCGEAYYYRYVMGRQVPSNVFQVQGRGVHKAAEKLHLSMIQNEPIGEAEMLQTYSDLYDDEIKTAVSEHNEDDADEKDANDKDIGVRLTKKYHKVALGNACDASGKPVPAVQPIAAERVVRVNIITEESLVIPFLGVIDLEERNAIADLKTKKKASSQADTDNSLQLSLYAHVTGKPLVRLDQLVKPTKTLPVRFIRTESVRTKNEVLHALDVVSQVAQDIASGRFRKTNPENWWCTSKWCPYWSDCRGRRR
jgi:hypothetical protein